MTVTEGNTICPVFSQNGIPCDSEKINPGRYKFIKPLPAIIPNMNSMFDVLVKVSSNDDIVILQCTRTPFFAFSHLSFSQVTVIPKKGK